MATFPSIPPSKLTISEPILPVTATFGDGYNQRYYVGINHTQKNFSLQWNNLNPTDGASIVSFFSTNGKAEQFFWVDPDGTTWKVFLSSQDDWTAERDGILYNITANFTQDFDYIP